MEILFEDRITEAGNQANQGSIDYVAHELQCAIDIHGESSPEALQCFLAFISIEQILEPDEEAHAHIVRYIDLSKRIYGLHSIEVATGFFLLGWSHAGLEREEEARLAIQQSSEQPGGKRKFPPLEPMLEALCGLLDKLQDHPKPEHARLPLVLGVHTLSWLVTYWPMQAPSFAGFVERLRPVLESRGFTGDTWDWLMRRCNRLNNHTIGLISVLLEERLVTVAPEDTNDSDNSGPDENSFVRGYAISGIKREHWTSPDGFSKTFPIMVAEGELSLRVERLLAEGCRYLRTKDELQTIFLIFSSHWVGRQITAFGTTTWSDEEKAYFENEVRHTIEELGADSAMMLTWVDLPHKESAKTGDEPREAVMVVARDAKSYLRGLQPARKIDGKYVFDEPMVRVARNNWFSEFTFPVQPAANESRKRTGKKKPKKKVERKRNRAFGRRITD